MSQPPHQISVVSIPILQMMKKMPEKFNNNFFKVTQLVIPNYTDGGAKIWTQGLRLDKQYSWSQ